MIIGSITKKKKYALSHEIKVKNRGCNNIHNFLVKIMNNQVKLDAGTTAPVSIQKLSLFVLSKNKKATCGGYD